MSSLRLTTRPTDEQQDAADRAERTRIDAIRRWRWGWYFVAVEVIALAKATRDHDLVALQRHMDHLGALVDGSRRVA